jgi:hypothetical protein
VIGFAASLDDALVGCLRQAISWLSAAAGITGPEAPGGQTCLALQLCLSAGDLGDVLQAGSLCLNFSLDCGSISRTDYEERARWPTCPPRRAQAARRVGQSLG